MQEKLKTLKIIHLAICAGTILAYIVLGQITSLDALKLPTIDNDSIVYLLIPFAAFSVSNLLFKMQLKKVNPKASVEENLPVYQTASIIRWAILEGANVIFTLVMASIKGAGPSANPMRIPAIPYALLNVLNVITLGCLS